MLQVRTAWPRRLKPLLDVLEEIGFEPRATIGRSGNSNAPPERLSLCAAIGSSDLRQFMHDLRQAIHRRPSDNDLWLDVCSSVMLHKTAEGITGGLRARHRESGTKSSLIRMALSLMGGHLFESFRQCGKVIRLGQEPSALGQIFSLNVPESRCNE